MKSGKRLLLIIFFVVPILLSLGTTYASELAIIVITRSGGIGGHSSTLSVKANGEVVINHSLKNTPTSYQLSKEKMAWLSTKLDTLLQLPLNRAEDGALVTDSYLYTFKMGSKTIELRSPGCLDPNFISVVEFFYTLVDA